MTPLFTTAAPLAANQEDEHSSEASTFILAAIFNRPAAWTGCLAKIR